MNISPPGHRAYPLMRRRGTITKHRNQMNIITKLLARYRERRDKKFRERIDRVYFHADEYGNRFMEGSFFAVKDESTGASGIICANPTITLEEVKKEARKAHTVWGQSFDGSSPIYSKGYLSVNGSNNPYHQEVQKD